MAKALDDQNPFEGWTSIEEAALIIGRSKMTLKRWADRGFVKSYTLGRKIRAVNIEEVKAYAAEHKPHEKN